MFFLTGGEPSVFYQGPIHSTVTACATGAHSIGDAARMIQFGDADVMIAGGTESSIDALSIAGFSRYTLFILYISLICIHAPVHEINFARLKP